jgi:putative ABC transport system permease protein
MRRPPRIAQAMLRRCVPEGLSRDSALGDLEEGFHERVRRRGAAYAAAWYWLQASALSLRYAVERIVNRRLYASARAGTRARQYPWDSTVQDLRFALRTLRRRPLFAAVAVSTLGLGIGAATAMFSVVHGVLLKPLPYDEPGRLVAVWQTVPQARDLPGDDGARWDRTRLTYSQYRDLMEKSTAYQGLAAYRAGTPDVATLTGIGDPAELRAGAATASLLALLGSHPVQGRWFLPSEQASTAGDDGASVAVLSYELWRDRFGASREAVGRTVTIDDRPFTIIGVLPPEFRIHWLSASVAGEGDPGKRDIWFPIGAPGWPASQQGYSWETIGRLTAGVTVEQALAETQVIMSAHPDTFGAARVFTRPAEETRGLAPSLVLLFGATGLLVLISCSNIATLSMAELQGRRHEIATRSALGAGRARIVRLVLTESLLLAMLGSAVGAGLAFAGTRALVALAPPIARLHEVGVDVRVLAFAILVGVCAAFLFGAGPSVIASRGSARPMLMGSARTSQARRRFARSVVGVEIALTAMLLVSGGLLTRSLFRLLAIDPGFDAEGLATVEVRLPRTRYPFSNPEKRVAFLRDALDQLEGIPGIGTVTAVSRLPFPGYTSAWGMQIEGRDGYLSPLGYQVGPGYLETLGVPLLAGRFLSETDGPDAPLAVVINETMARRYWPDASPIGARLNWGGSEEPVTVVGVVGDMKRQVLYAAVEPAFFIPFSQHPDETVCFVARTQMEPSEIFHFMREAVGLVDRDLVVKNATTIAALVAQSASHERYRTLLFTSFGILAALLAAAGVFGVTARSVALRTRELGIRMALGAREFGLIGTTVREMLCTGIAGTAVGLMGALWSSRLVARFLFGIEPWDPTTYAVVAALTVAVCLLASFAPARRITKVNPVEVLRAE